MLCQASMLDIRTKSGACPEVERRLFLPDFNQKFKALTNYRYTSVSDFINMFFMSTHGEGWSVFAVILGDLG
jgi:hypothetical protein